MRERSSAERGWLFPLIMAIIVGLIGLWLTGLGAYLASLGGSLYYVLAGLGLLGTAILLFRRNAAALVVYAVVLAGTLIWAIAEVGLDFWQLSPRGNLLMPIAVVLLLPWLTRALRPATSAIRGAGLALSAALACSVIVLVAALFQNPHDQQGELPGVRATGVTYAAAPGD